MMKRLSALLLALALVLTTMSTAFAWSCPSCGNEMSGNFCTQCGTRKPAENICPSCGTNHGDMAYAFCPVCGAKLGEPAAAVTPVPADEAPVISEILENDNGTVAIMWNADGTSTYEIRYMLKDSDDVAADMNAESSIGYETSTSTIGFFTLTKLVPGESYWIGVFDGQGKGDYVPFEPENAAQPFDAFSNSLYGWPVVRQGGQDVKQDYLTVGQMTSGGAECGLLLAMSYDNPGEAYKPLTHIVFEAPNGAKKVMYATYVTFEAEMADVVGWQFISLNEYIAALEDAFGEVFVGEHKASVYLDGKLLGTQPFSVADQAVVTAAPPTAAPAANGPVITGINENGDGTVTVTWNGDGKSTYRVQYIRKFSDDAAADKENPVSLGMWYSETTESAFSLARLVPGESYWIGVFDEQGKGEYQAYEPQREILPYTEVETEMLLESSIRVEDTTTLVNVFNALDVASGDTACGLRVGFSYNNPGAEKEIFVQLVVEAPNGAARVTTASMATIGARTENSLGWSFYDLAEYFDLMAEYFGSVPLGQYKTSIYVNGQLVGTKVFEVVEAKETEEDLYITRLKYNTDGSVSISWSDNGKGPYTVYYFERWSDAFAADKEDPRTSAYWRAAENLTEASVTLKHLVPGLEYWIEVEDSTGEICRIKCNAISVQPANMGMSVNLIPRMKENDKYTDLRSFAAAALNEEYTEEYGIYLSLDYNPIETDTQKACQIVMTLPNGVSFCESAFDVNLFANGNTYWEFFSLDWAFGRVKAWNDGMLLGKYTLDFYIDGKLAGSASFQVVEESTTTASGIYIDGVTQNDDGSITVRWTDVGGKGPYTIEYGQKVSNSFSADKEGDGSSIIFRDTRNATGGSHTLNFAVPGVPQWIAVYNSEGEGEHISYEPKAARPFSGFGVELSVRLKTRRNNSTTEVARISAADIAEGRKDFGMRLECIYPKLDKVRSYKVRVAITAPNGSSICCICKDVTMNSGKASSFYWDFYDLEGYFNTLINNFGSVPVGQYTVTMYFDNYVAGAAIFNVTK